MAGGCQRRVPPVSWRRGVAALSRKQPGARGALPLAELEGQRLKAGLPSAKFSAGLYKNAALLELGLNDARQIRVEMK
jgi:hypothetical protein